MDLSTHEIVIGHFVEHVSHGNNYHSDPALLVSLEPVLDVWDPSLEGGTPQTMVWFQWENALNLL